MVTEIFR